jgi:SAM-dependent methyltransferase
MKCPTFDPFWEDARKRGIQICRYPFDLVVSFIYRNAPLTRPREEVRILEIGFGTGNNLWFAAREGFSVAGIEGSPTAVEYARKRFEEDGLEGDLRQGDFTRPLPFENRSFDLAVDRASITCTGFSAGRKLIREVNRVLGVGGRFLFNPYSKSHSSFSLSRPGPDGLTLDIRGGTLADAGQICFYDRSDVIDAFGDGWKLLSLQHLEVVEELQQPEQSVHAEWRVVAERVDTDSP